MKNEPNFETFHQAFSSRIEINAALDGALDASVQNFERLKKACLELETTISIVDKGDVEDQYRAYHAAITIFAILAEWKHAIRNAEQDAQRFLNSAKLKASEAKKSSAFSADERLRVFLDQVAGVKSVNELDVIQDHLKQWSLPLLLFANLPLKGFGDGRIPVWNRNSEEPEKLETTVAFLKFDIDGEPAQQWNYLKPGTSYDLTIEVRVSHWPKGASSLSLKPVTVDIREKDWLPSFTFEKPEGDGPFILTGTGRAVLEIAHSFGSRPYEFLYAAEFDDTTHCRDVAIVGHRRLLLEGSDVNANPLTGFSNVDRHLLSIRDKLRTFPGLHTDDLANTMILLSGLGNIAAQALRDGLFEAGTSEAIYQNEATKMLRNRSDIGEHLQGHPAAAGGITDLTFRDIPLELKVENEKALFPKDFKKYFKQTAAYAIGLGKRLGVLSVLESSPKNEPIGIVEDDIEVFMHSSGQSQVIIVVAIIRGGFPKPSTYSR
ncbi:hypothetical protein FE845_08050 [Marinobacter sp. 1-4A]|uniref:hypothetical protein n=1 Tax=Marinobacter sp. 1-4A TaxID=2582919 RepID=UPI001903BF53|nr:hypothetical protein [Marinobacter sp. 1-4A]MBK1851291.1 hypothetical protein [Marinobacter sp. 1-4A]